MDAVRDLLGQGRWAIGTQAPERGSIREGDHVCIYVGRVGIVADATATGAPARGSVSSVRDLTRYPWVIGLRDVRCYFDTPIVVDAALRAKLDAFAHRDDSRPWGWFVKRGHVVSDRDFAILTGRQT